MLMLVQVFRLAAADDAVHIAVSGHGEVHFFHGRSLGLGWLDTRAVIELHVIEQSLEPLQRSRGGRHFCNVRMYSSNKNNNNGDTRQQ
jgi:hypothetical protein